MVYYYVSGADIAFDKRTFNRLFCKPILHVMHILIANTFASKVKGAVASLASAFRAPAFAPVVA